jgi:ribosomal protein S27E
MVDERDEAVVDQLVAQMRDRHHVRELRPPSRFGRTLTFWAPRRFVGPSGIDVDAFVAELDETIRTRGMVLYDRQILTTSLGDAEFIESLFEPDSPGEAFEVPGRCEWDTPHREYFGLEQPYQMADEPGPFTWSHLVISIAGPYLRAGEAIAALLHGHTDRRYVTCPCHNATVVYTTQHRVLCMACGMTHAVLREPLALVPGQLLSAEEWVAYFDHDGTRRDEVVDLATIDFREIEEADLIWSTDQWDAAAHELIFFARSSHEEIEKALRGTEADPSILIEAGWTKVDLPPPPAFQLMPDSVDVDLVENAEHAFSVGVAEFLASCVTPERLVSAVPDLFRAIELLLKARLLLSDEHALDDRPNNPTVLARLQRNGVVLSRQDVEAITTLRQLRNDLQHGSAVFNHRQALGLCRSAVVFVDGFVDTELACWVGDVIRDDAWRKLLTIPEIAATAERIATQRIASSHDNTDAEITRCPECGRDTMIRPHPSTGARCAYCDYVPVQREDRPH